jgi:RHS repeat-associated protein
LDDNGSVISYEEYFPYGSTSYQAVYKNIKAAAKRYRYTGKERDEETGFTYHGARYYAAWLGRWVSCDPMGIGAGVNAYVYAAASPVCLTDHDGLEPGHPEDVDTRQLWIEGTAPAPAKGTPQQSTSQSSSLPTTSSPKTPPPPKADPQLNFSERPVFDFDVKATAKGSGIGREHRQYGRDLTDLWGGPKRYDLSHRKSLVATKQGETGKVGIEERSANRSRGASEREAGGVRSGSNKVDPTATPGAKNVQPKPPSIQTVKPSPLKITETPKVSAPPSEPVAPKPVVEPPVVKPVVEPPVVKPVVEPPVVKPVVEPPVVKPSAPTAAGPSALEGFAGKIGSITGVFFHILAVDTLAKDIEMLHDPGSPALGPVGTRRTDSTGTVWIKTADKEWVTQATYDKML